MVTGTVIVLSVPPITAGQVLEVGVVGIKLQAFIQYFFSFGPTVLGEEIGDTMAVISSWGRSFIVVDSEGLIYPAPFLMHKKELVMGSIRNGDNIYELWKNAPILKKLRNLTKERIGCGNCRMDCAFSNPFFSYSYFGEFGHVLPHIDCINKRFQ